jgi:hypothetical protein
MSTPLECQDLGLPLSAVFVPGSGCTPEHSLTLSVVHGNYGTVTMEPNRALYCPNEVVTLTAVPIEGKGFGGWAVWGDPNKYPDGNYIIIQDANTVLHLTMDQDYLAEVTFKCGSGVEQVLPLLGMLFVTGVAAMRRWRRNS